jgi:hypothetical protein
MEQRIAAGGGVETAEGIEPGANLDRPACSIECVSGGDEARQGLHTTAGNLDRDDLGARVYVAGVWLKAVT